MENYSNRLNELVDNMEKVMIGKREAVELGLICLLCRGHLLIEDVPGVGKTSFANALAKSVDGTFRRIQFTPDIMPSDITGFSVYNMATGTMDYKEGAIMSHFILADEINRTSPKTQSSLLEAMEERQVTVDGNTYTLPQPFMVLATQNPVEYLGTFPLPEAQLDRFFMRISIGYPTLREEALILERFKGESPLNMLPAVINCNEVSDIQKAVENIFVNEKITEYIVSVVDQTRRHRYVELGASPRGSLNLYKAAQAWALYNGRDFVTPDDVVKMASHVLAHRMVMRQEAQMRKVTSVNVIEEAIEGIRVG
ncbi:MAG: MoxR family ATPase [Defluviitaleaceae bacterium]|nr:MoxR family ATPase [Defluviitaleaceae bacterium]